MARKRPSKIVPKTDAGRRPTALVVKGTPAWREWLEATAGVERVNVSALVDRALAEYAARHKLDPPPDR